MAPPPGYLCSFLYPGTPSQILALVFVSGHPLPDTWACFCIRAPTPGYLCLFLYPGTPSQILVLVFVSGHPLSDTCACFCIRAQFVVCLSLPHAKAHGLGQLLMYCIWYAKI